MKILLVVNAGYNSGTARSKRFKSFAKGLSSLGNDCMLLFLGNNCIDVQCDNDCIESCEKYKYKTIKSHSLSKRFFNRLFGNFLDGRQLKLAFLESLKTEKWDCVLLYGQSCLLYHPIASICGKRNIPCIADLTEWYSFNLKRLFSNNYWDHFLHRVYLLKKLSGVIAISKIWERYSVKHGIKVIRIPAMEMTDAGKKQNLCILHEIKGHERFIVTYVGSMSERDLPDIMINGISNALKRNLNLEFVVIGNVDSQRRGRLIKRRVGKKLRDRITFTNWVDSREMVRLLSASDAFVLLRDDNMFSHACFPTRLPEYLETGKPVIISDVGDISDYLAHKKNAWLLSTHDQAEGFADAIEYLASNPDDASKIGAAGKKLSIKAFSYIKHSKRFEKFIKRLN